MDEKKYKQQNNNNNLCWILDYKIRDVLPLFIIKLELNDKKNLRLVCQKFQLIIDNYSNLFNLIFRLKIDWKIEKQELEKIINFNSNITSFSINGNIDKNADLIQCIPNYTKELELYNYRNKLLERKFYFRNDWTNFNISNFFFEHGVSTKFDFKIDSHINDEEKRLHLSRDEKLKKYQLSTSIESLKFGYCTFSLKFWNSIPSSLLYLYCHHVRIINKHGDMYEFENFQSNLKELYINRMNLFNIKSFPKNLVQLTLIKVMVTSDQILNLSKISSLSYLELNRLHKFYEKIDLSNFNSLKILKYKPETWEKSNIYEKGLIFRKSFDFIEQSIYLPFSILFETLILNKCKDVNLKTLLPKSLINIEINNPDPDLYSFLLKEENKLPFLKSFSIIIYDTCSYLKKTLYSDNIHFQLEYIPKILHQYDQLEIFKINLNYYPEIPQKILNIMFSYIPPNLQKLQIDQCPKKCIDYIIKLFENNFWKIKNDPCLLSFYKEF